MSDEQIQQWRALGTRFIQVVPEVQIHTAQDNHDGVLRVGIRKVVCVAGSRNTMLRWW